VKKRINKEKTKRRTRQREKKEWSSDAARWIGLAAAAHQFATMALMMNNVYV
jgi:hypothetical protein